MAELNGAAARAAAGAAAPAAAGANTDGRGTVPGRVVGLLHTRLGSDLVGVYLHGSAVEGGLRPDSDLDLLAVTRRPLDARDRRAVVDLLLSVSGRRATEGPSRPVELTSVVLGDIVPWTYPPNRDFRYGEWLREEYVEGVLPERERDPDLAVVLRAALDSAEPLLGPDPADLLPTVPDGDLRRAILDSLPSLLDDLEGDERNVLLTLARMVVTLGTGEIVPKDVAAQVVSRVAPAGVSATLERARAAYLGVAPDDWTPPAAHEEAAAAAAWLAVLLDQDGSA